MGGEGILLIQEAVHQGGIIQDCNGDLEGQNDSRDLMSIVDSIAQDQDHCLVSSALMQTLGAKMGVKRCSSTVGSIANTTIRRWSSRILLKTGSRLAHWKPNFRQRYFALGMRSD